MILLGQFNTEKGVPKTKRHLLATIILQVESDLYSRTGGLTNMLT